MSPSQTIGPLYGFALMFDGCQSTLDPDEAAAIRLHGRILDGAGAPVAYPEGMIEFWHGDQWGRARTDEDGWFRLVVRKPGALALPDGRVQAPHLNLAVFARGLLKQAQTRVYFPDEAAANEADPVLELVPRDDRHTLIAKADGDALRFDVHLQGEGETVFFSF